MTTLRFLAEDVGKELGPEGESAVVVSTWFIPPGEAVPRFVTAYPGGRR